jgi:hypothetical protein
MISSTSARTASREMSSDARGGRDSLSFVDQSQKDVLGSEIVAKQARFLLRQHHHAMGPVRELLEHVPSVRHSAAETLLADYCFVV